MAHIVSGSEGFMPSNRALGCLYGGVGGGGGGGGGGYLSLGLGLLLAVLGDEAVGLGQSQGLGLQQVLQTALLGLGTHQAPAAIRQQQ